MPTINDLPPATEVDPSDELPISQGGVCRSVTVELLLSNTQPALTLARGTLLGRVSDGPGGPEPVALGTGLQIEAGVLVMDQSDYPTIGTLSTSNQVILNDTSGNPALMPISLLRGLYQAGQNITINPDGTISSTPAVATGSSIGAVAVGNGLIVNASGTLSVNVGTVLGTIAAGDDPRIVGAQQTAQKGLPNGYASLDSTGKVPASQLPPGGNSPVLSVAGKTGNVVLTTADISGLGSIATESANAVAITGGTIAGANTSNAAATASFAPAVSRTLAAHFSDNVNINDFGLARDGVTDDSLKFIAACQAAMNGNLKLYIPAGGPILLTDNLQINLANISIYGDGIRDYDSPNGYGHVGSTLWFTGTTKSPFLLGPACSFQGLTFFWPNQTETATVNNNNLPIVYPPLFAQQSPAQNIVYFNFIDCQVTNCYDFFTQASTSAVVGACAIERCIIYAIHNCFTLQYVPEVFFIGNTLFTFGVYGTVVSVGPTFNLRTFTNTQGTWLKIVGNGTTNAVSTTTVGGIMSVNVYVFGFNRGIWLSGGTLDISTFTNTSFDNVPVVIQGDPGCAIFSTRFLGGTWYPIFFASGNPDTTAIQITNPAPGGTNCNFSGVTIPFVDGSLATIAGTNVAQMSFDDIRCTNLGHTTGGTGPYHGFTFNTPNAILRISNCDFAPSNGGLQNTGIQITACTSALINNCTFRSLSAPIDIETTSGVVTLSGNTTTNTQATSPILGIAQTNLHDLFNNWDKPTYVYNGYAPLNYRAGATIGLQPVASTSASAYVGVQPSALGSSGGTRMGVTALGTSPVSLLTNGFTEEQLRVNRTSGAVNYVTVRGALSGSPSLISAAGADGNASVQLSALPSGMTYLGTQGVSGSPVIHLGAQADQSYVGIAPANGFSITVPVNCSTVLLKPAATLTAGSIVLPAALADGERIEIWTSKTINSLTVTSPGAVVNNGAGFTLAANATVGFFWNAANATWFQRLGGGSANGTIAQQDASNVNITGGSVTGLSALQVGGDAATSSNIVLDSASGFARQVVYESAGLPRWIAGAQGTAENIVPGTTSAAAASGATKLTLASLTGLAAGMLVNAVGVPSGTTIASINNGTSVVTLSQATTAAIASGATITFYTNQGSDYAILPFDDTGAPLAGTLGQSFLITRATGLVTIKTLAVIGTANAPTPVAGDVSTQIATTAFVANNTVTAAKMGAPNGVATLDANGHVPASQLPPASAGALTYQGAWNPATNTPALSSGTGVAGAYFTASVTGSTVLDGIGQWNAGDHAAFNGQVWEKLDGLTSEVTSVAGRTGAVTLSSADIPDLGTMARQSGSAVAITGGTAQNLSLLSVGSSSGGTVSSFINAAAGSARQLVYQTSGVTRWNVAATAIAESNLTLVTSSATSGSTTLNFPSTTGIVAGQLVSGTGIPGGTTVATFTATTVTLSASVTVAAGTSVFFYTNTGSNFAVVAYDDNGMLLSTPLSIARNTGALGILGTIATTALAPIVIQGGNAVLGNARGLGAFDGQQNRTTNSQVASGQSASAFGANNTASSNYSTALGFGNTAAAIGAITAGYSNTATGLYSFVCGHTAVDRGRTSHAFASANNGITGDTQTAFGLLSGNSTISAATRLTADASGTAGSSNVWNIPNNTACKLRLEILGWSVSGVQVVGYTASVKLVRGASVGSTRLTATTLAADSDNDTITGLTAPSLAVDAVNGGLNITSGFSTGATMRWAARVISAVELQ